MNAEERRAFADFLERDTENRDIRTFLPWMALLLTLWAGFRSIGPTWEVLKNDSIATFSAAVMLGALSYIALSNVVEALLEHVHPRAIPEEFPRRKHLMRMLRRKHGLWESLTTDSLTRLVIIFSGFGIAMQAIWAAPIHWYALLPLSLMLSARQLSRRAWQPKWFRRNFRRAARKLENGAAATTFAMSMIILLLYSYLQLPTDTELLVRMLYVSAFTTFAFLSCHFLLRVMGDHTRRLMAQLRFELTFTGISVAEARELYCAIELLRELRIAAIHDIGQLRTALGLTSPPESPLVEVTTS